MEQTPIEEIDKGYLCSECHINKHPIPNFVKTILFQFSNVEYFRKIHFTQRKTKYY